MPMSVRYATVNGQLVEEDRGGVVTCYVLDTLGSVVKTTDASGNITSETTYWPFGEIRTQTGTNPSPWGFVGSLGYYRDIAARLYVRARYYRTRDSRWNIVDPLWPGELAYQYAIERPVDRFDKYGLAPVVTEGMARSGIRKSCNVAQWLLAQEGRSDVYGELQNCVSQCSPKCPAPTRKNLLCLQRYACFQNSLEFNKGDCAREDGPCAYVEAPGGVRQGGCTREPSGVKIYICDRCASPGCNPLGTGVPVTDAIIHELLHCCGIAHGPYEEPNTCNSVMTCCMLKAVGLNPPGHRCCR